MIRSHLQWNHVGIIDFEKLVAAHHTKNATLRIHGVVYDIDLS
jgi:hypothetical protein